MNLVNTYLLLPLQRKIFKNFGHYDYNTSTFHLNEERVNEVFFDPAFNPFVDVLRETSHASAVASSKSAASRRATPSAGVRGEQGEAVRATSSPSPRQQPQQRDEADDQSGVNAGSAGGGASGTTSAAAETTRTSPCVRLLQGKFRSAGLLSFLRQATTQKSLTVESVDLVFSVAAAGGGASGSGPVDEGQEASAASSPPTVAPLAADSTASGEGEGNASLAVGSSDASFPLHAAEQEADEAAEQRAVAAMSRSYSLEDHFSLFNDALTPSSPSAPAATQPASTTTTTTAAAAASPTAFHTVGDLVSYLKSRLQGLTVGVEEVRLTFCISPADAPLRQTQPSYLLRGTRVLHLSSRRGLRFTVEEATGSAVEDMRCSAAMNDWQCYLHVMAEDGPVPTAFTLDELLLTTTASVGPRTAASPAPADSSKAAAPITVHLERRSGPPCSAGDAPAVSAAKIMLDVDATGAWSVLLSAAQLGHLVDVVQLLSMTSASAQGGTSGTSTPAATTAASASAPPSLSSRWDADVGAALEARVAATPLASGDAVAVAAAAAATALAATQLPPAAKYISVHSAGCSITLLTASAVEPGVVARAWAAALSPQQRSLLTSGVGKVDVGATTLTPVFDSLASPHFTYVMRDVDVLFPNIEADSSSATALLSRVFAADRKKRSIYRNLFKNNLADPRVTKQLESEQHHHAYCCQSFFLGIGSIALVEYRQAAAHATVGGGTPRLLRPAQLLQAERVPYALVVFHRITPPLLETEADPLSATAKSNATSPSPAAASSRCVHRETVVVGLARIVLQLDPGLLDVLTSYAMTLHTQIEALRTHAADRKSGGTTPLSQPQAAATKPDSLRSPTPTPAPARTTTAMRTRNTLKVLFESLEASIRFPLEHRQPEGCVQTATTAAASAIPATIAHSTSLNGDADDVPFAALPSLLARLLQRLRETSLHSHRHLRAQLARPKSGQEPGEGAEVEAAGRSSAIAAKVQSLSALQEKLGFPEDAEGKARFLPEFLCFSLRDLQLEQHQSTTPACETEVQAAAATTTAVQQEEPVCSSVRWREAVVHTHDVLEGTTSELLRVDYSPEMSIRITHAGVPDCTAAGSASRRWHALRRVLTLQVRLGDITTAVLTQDDFLLASHYAAELLRALTHCRQRLHGAFADAQAGGMKKEDGAAQEEVIEAREAMLPLCKEEEVSQFEEASNMWAADHTQHIHPTDFTSGTVAEAFAVADASRRPRSTAPPPRTRGDGIDTRQRDSGFASLPLSGRERGSPADLVPELWCYPETTCTALDVRVGRIRLGLFAPRLSPMGLVVGEPLVRCLPAAQRRQLIDLDCLYHTYVAEFVDVALSVLIGSGEAVGLGQDTFVRVRFSSFSLWERQPLVLPAGANGQRERAGGGGGGSSSSGGPATGAASVSLYNSYVAGVVQPSSATQSAAETMHQQQQQPRSEGMSGGGARRDLGYYMSSRLHRTSTLVQLVQSFTEAKSTAQEAGSEKAKDGTCHNSVEASDATRSAHAFLQETWEAYLRELPVRQAEAPQEERETAGSTTDSGVCEVRLLGHDAGPAESSKLPAPSSPSLSLASRYVCVQLSGLGLHHTVAYNGDHLAAVLQKYFNSGAPAARDGAPSTPASPPQQHRQQTPASVAAPAVTVVQLELRNLMATYRPRGVGRSLAVVLLPRASVLVRAPAAAAAAAATAESDADAPEPLEGNEGGNNRAGKHRGGEVVAEGTATAGAASAGAVASPHLLAMQAQAWLHTSVPIFVCNDCEVEALAREVLDPAEGDDWAVDLEGAGFVRLCEVVSTAPSFSAPNAAEMDDTPSPFSLVGAAPPHLLQRQPNLTVTLPMQTDDVGAAPLGAAGRSSSGGTDCEWAVAVRLRYLELSAFMAKDAFDVLRDLVETWGSGADLQVMDTPAALVMRSGPGFDWVAEEVARSCAPMTFQLNPGLSTGNDGAAAAPAIPSSGPPSSSPLGLPEATLTSLTDVSSTPPTYGYSRWRDALHAAQGRDQRLAEAYQARVSALLDQRSPWVAVRRPVVPLPAFTAQAPRASVDVAAAAADVISIPSDEDEMEEDGVAVHERGAVGRYVAIPSATTAPAAYPHTQEASRGFADASSPVSSPPQRSSVTAAAAVSSVSSSFSDMSDLATSTVPLEWHVVSFAGAEVPMSEALRWVRPAVVARGGHHNVVFEDDVDAMDDSAARDGFDLCAACERQPHFLSCWSRHQVDAASQSCAVSLDQLDRTDDALLHDTADRYLYPPVQLQFFLCDCALNVSLYEGTDLMAAAVRKQRQGYLQIISPKARVGEAAPTYSMHPREKHAEAHQPEGRRGNSVTRRGQQPSLSASQASRSIDTTTANAGVASAGAEVPCESSASRLNRLHSRGCRSGFGDRDASKHLVLSCRGITVQLDTFPQASEEDMWFHVVVGEVTVFDCIKTSDVHRLLTATPQLSAGAATSLAARATPPAASSSRNSAGRTAGGRHGARSSAAEVHGGERRGAQDGSLHTARQLELTGLLTSSKSVHMAARREVADDSRAGFTVSHFQQGGSELSLAVRLQPTSLTWSGASVDFAQSFFFSSAPTAGAGGAGSGESVATGSGGAESGARTGVPFTTTHAGSDGSLPVGPASHSGDVGIISGTEAPPIFFRRVVILPTTLTIAGSFQSDKGVLAALAEGRSLDALRSVPVLSWISVQEIPLPIPLMRIEECSSAVTLLQRIVEDSNCVSIRFLLTALCCGLQPLSAVARVGEAAKGLLLLPLSQYRGAALHHAIRTASSVFMQELLTQTSGVAALLASGSYHASRSLLEALVAPSDRRLTLSAEPSRALQPTGVVEGWRQGQEQLRLGLDEALAMASYCTGPDGSLMRLPAAALRMLMGVSGAATTTLWGVRNSQNGTSRTRDGYIYKK